MCTRTQKVLCKDEFCDVCFIRSFASSHRAPYWHREKNTLTPREVARCSNKKFWFKCEECHHTFDKALHTVDRSWCRYCSGQDLCGMKSCSYCFKRSLASHKVAKSIAPESSYINLHKVGIHSGRSINFLCKKCKHNFTAIINNVTGKKTWCPYCCKGKSTFGLCDKKKCDHCEKRSLASHWISEFWSPRNNKVPRFVPRGTDTKYWFLCNSCGHEYKTSVSSITSPSNYVKTNRCHHCKNKTERHVFSFLKCHWETIPQATFDWCRTTKSLPYDFCLPNERLMICVDGRQHFQQVMKWQSPAEQFHRDQMKTYLALEHGYSVLRICQEDIWGKKVDWREAIRREAARKDCARIVTISTKSLYDSWIPHFDDNLVCLKR